MIDAKKNKTFSVNRPAAVCHRSDPARRAPAHPRHFTREVAALEEAAVPRAVAPSLACLLQFKSTRSPRPGLPGPSPAPGQPASRQTVPVTHRGPQPGLRGPAATPAGRGPAALLA